MPIIGFGFNKVIGEKNSPFTKQDKIQTNVNIVSIKSENLKMGKEERPALKVNFEFKTEYGKAGRVQFNGFMLYMDSPERIKELSDMWSKEQKLPPQFGELVYNFALAKSNIKALTLEQDLGLPYHLSLPRVKVKKKK